MARLAHDWTPGLLVELASIRLHMRAVRCETSPWGRRRDWIGGRGNKVVVVSTIELLFPEAMVGTLVALPNCLLPSYAISSLASL